MKRYSFGLAAVLRARKLQQDVAKADLQKANMAATAAELAAKASLEHYRQVNVPEDGRFLAQRQHAELAAGSLVGARQAVVAARAAVEEAMARYVDAAKAVSVLEHLDERRRHEHRLAVQHEEAGIVDDLVVSRHARQEQRRRREGAQP